MAKDIIQRYRQHQAEDTLPRSPRGIFYDLRPTGFGNGASYVKHPAMVTIGHDRHGKPRQRKADPMECTPQDVQQVILKLRRALKLPEGWVADTRAPNPALPAGWDSAEDLAEYVRLLADRFTLQIQKNQPVYVEVLCEAEGLVQRLTRVAGEYGVPVYSGGGFDGLKGKRDFGRRAAARHVPTLVLAVSDFDEYGLNIFTAASEDSVAWSLHEGAEDGQLNWERIALTEAQAVEFGLLDTAGKAEVDGVPVPDMDRILREAIERYQDPARRAALVSAEEAERDAIPEAIRRSLEDGR